MPSPQEQILEIITSEDKFFLLSHINPDGDAIGAMVGLSWILSALNKEVVQYSPEGMPDRFDWLQSPVPVQQTIPSLEDYRTFILDCGDINRVGEEAAGRLIPEKSIVIDHHVSNTGFGSINWIDPARSSVGDMIADLADGLSIPLKGHLAEALYLAIASDTGFFTFGNTSPESLEIVARMIREGLDPGPLNAAIQNQWSINRLRLQGRVLQNAELVMDGKVGLLTVTNKILEETGTAPEECEGLVNLAIRIHGVEVAAILRENGNEQIKFSLRSVGPTDVQQIAKQLSGGGHRNASGGTITAPLPEAREKLLQSIADYLHEH